MSTTDDNANLVMANIERSEREILALYKGPVTTPGLVGYQHFYLFGIARRALAQSAAFRQMIVSRNSLVASSILRLQLDTVLRLYALFWVADPEDFASKVFKGTAVDKLKAADGSLMKDKYLRDRVAVKNEWVPSVYTSASGYIHFSDRHIKAAIHMKDSKTGHAQVQIGPYDVDKSISYYGELLRAFLHLNMMIPVAAGDWFSRIKENGTSASVGQFPFSAPIPDEQAP
jgi:hypothetical protein